MTRPVAPASPGRRAVAGLVAGLALATLPLLVDRGAVPAAAALHALAEGGVRPQLLLHVRLPLVVVSSLALLLAPGLLLASALRATASWSRWLLAGLALSLVVVSAAAGVVQAATGDPLRGGAFVAVVLGCTAAAAALAWRRAGAPGAAVPEGVGRALLVNAAAATALLLALLPKFIWENFNGDGAHAFESARLLLTRPLPFWDAGAGVVGGFPGITSMVFAFPASWFVRLFGELEVSARLPLLLGLAGTHAGLVGLAEHGRRALRLPESAAIWAALALYTVVVGYSATYSPYSADLALPASQDTLLVALFLGAALAFVGGRAGWLALFAALTYLALPNGVLLLGLLGLASAAVMRPLPGRMLGVLGGVLAACVAGGVLAPSALAAAGLPAPGGEYASARLLERFAHVQVADWRRLAYLVVPAGALPALALLAWRRQDGVARALTLVTLAYFAFCYVQAYASLHYYIPAMLLPIAVYWRLAPDAGRARLAWAGASVAGVLACLVPSRPEQAAPYLAAREVAATMRGRLDGYARSAPGAFRGAEALRHVFPLDWEPVVPGVLAASPLVWNYYLHQPSRAAANYLLQPAAAPPPAGFRLVGAEGGAAVYVRSDSLWAAHRATRPASPAGAPLFRIEPAVLFHRAHHTHAARIYDVRELLAARGLLPRPRAARAAAR